jgi:hypothetical protein
VGTKYSTSEDETWMTRSNRPKDIWLAKFILQCGYVHFVVGNVHLGRSSMFTTNLSYLCSRILSYITSYMLILGLRL